jgi:hypothetical protein
MQFKLQNIWFPKELFRKGFQILINSNLEIQF